MADHRPSGLAEIPAGAQSPQVPIQKRLCWGLGGVSDAMIIQGTAALVSVIYINALKFSPAMVGLACAVPRFFDAASDPVVGHLSDNTRSRFGRRRPWILAGLVLAALLGLLIWFPPATGANGAPSGLWPLLLHCVDNPTFWYLAVMMTLLYAVAYTFFNIPHVAMGYEMTTDYNERTHLFKWRQMFYSLAGFLTPWLLPLCMAMEGSAAQELRGSRGVIWVSVMCGGVILLAGLPSVLFCREKVAAHAGEAKVRFLDAVRLTLGNRPFWLLVVCNFVAKFCMAVTGVFFVYIFIYHIGRGDQKAGSAYLAVFFNAINISSLLAMAPVAMLASRMGKKPAMLLMLSMSVVAYLSLWMTFSNAAEAYVQFPVPWGGTLSFQWPSLFTAILIGVFTNTMPMINNSMLADVCDLDEVRSGHRREAFYAAVFTTMDKMALTAALLLQGFLLAASGFDANLVAQGDGTIRYWFLALMITQPVGFVIGLAAIVLYPLTRERCQAIRNELDARSQGAA